MSDLDPTAQRANEPGWTKDAIRESRRLEKKEDKAARKADKAKRSADRRAAWSKFWGAVGRGIAAVWDFMIRNILLTAGITGVVCIGIFEWANGARGWGDLYPSFNGLVVGAGAAAAVLVWYVAVSMAIDEWKKRTLPEGATPDPAVDYRDLTWAIGWTVAACLAYFVTVSGVFVATATNSVKYQQLAKDSRLELANLKIKVAELEDELEVYNEAYWNQNAAQIQRAIDSRTNIARNAWGLADLKVDGGCASPKLAFEARRMCVRVNGGDDPTTGEVVQGIRTELENAQREAERTRLAQLDLDAKRLEVKNFHVVEGDQTAQALEDLSEGEWKGERAIAFLYWLLSSAFLLVGGWVGHWVLMEIRKKRAAARKLKGLPA